MGLDWAAGMTPLMPVVNGVSGDLAGIAVSKLSTELHAERRHRVRAELRAAAAAKAQPQLQLQHAHSTDSVSSALSEAVETCGRSCCAEFESPAATFCAFSCAHMSIYEHSDALLRAHCTVLLILILDLYSTTLSCACEL